MNKILDKATGIFRVFSCAVFGIALIATLINIVGRAAFHMPLQGTTEIIQYGTMLAMAVVMSRTGFEGRHVSVNLFTTRLPKTPQRIIAVFDNLIGAGVFGGIAYLYIKYINENLVKVRVSDTLRIPYWALYVIMFFGFTLGAIIFCYQAVIQLKNRPEEAEAPKQSTDND